jgi:methionyl-tRNA formyltransferase
MNELRVLFFGMLGTFSLPPLKALLEAGFSVVAVVVPADKTTHPIRELKLVTAVSASSMQADATIVLTPKQSNIVRLAWQHHIPVYEVSRLSAPETRLLLTSLQPDVACVACFNKRIPPNILALPHHGFLNVHPSLLPQFRGPAPLFWTFRAGIQNTGVTVHFMDEGLDTGDIVQQAPLTLPDGITGPEADELMGKLGGQHLVSTLNQLANDALTRTPQPSLSSSHPWPQAADFHIPVSWSAQRAYNFMRGTAVFGQPFIIEGESEEIVTRTAVSYQLNSQLKHPIIRQGSHVQIQFTDGILTILL